MNETLEYAQTQHGDGRRYDRPDSVRRAAQRMTTWGRLPETCSSCSSHEAVRLVGGRVPLCARCGSQWEARTRRDFAAPAAPTAAPTHRADAKAVVLGGLAIAVNTLSVDLGGFCEVITPQALDRFERERPDLRALWSHDPAQPLGRIASGTMRAWRTSRGLEVAVQPPDGTARLVALVRRGDVSAQSFGFIALLDDWHRAGDRVIRSVLDMRILETSFVSWPAYEQTSAQAGRRAARDHRKARTLERLRLAS